MKLTELKGVQVWNLIIHRAERENLGGSRDQDPQNYCGASCTGGRQPALQPGLTCGSRAPLWIGGILQKVTTDGLLPLQQGTSAVLPSGRRDGACARGCTAVRMAAHRLIRTRSWARRNRSKGSDPRNDCQCHETEINSAVIQVGFCVFLMRDNLKTVLQWNSRLLLAGCTVRCIHAPPKIKAARFSKRPKNIKT